MGGPGGARRLEECAHFHYEFAEIGPLQVGSTKNTQPGKQKYILFWFLAVQNSSIGDLVTHWLSDFWFWHYRVTLETCDIWDIWSEWWEDMTWPKNIYLPSYLPTYLHTYLPTYLIASIREHPKRSYHRDFRHFTLRHWLQYWQLRTWINDNICYLTINCDTGQHSQFLGCLSTFTPSNSFYPPPW